MNKKYSGGCHCGEVRFEVTLDASNLLDCNCSICFKKGHLLAFTPENNFTLLKGEKTLKAYLFNKKIIQHFFCSNCGISSFGKGTAPDGSNVMAINARCLDNFDLASASINKYDGKSL